MQRRQKFRIFFAAAVVVCEALVAQAPSAKQAEFDAIYARAGDAEHPQTPDLNRKQLLDWSTKYNEHLTEKTVSGGRSAGGLGPASPMADSCPGRRTINRGRLKLHCILVLAEATEDGVKCTYDCT
jgi:hypothetical protein